MAELGELRQFVGRPEVRADQFWRGVLGSDPRSIFPKRELARIEIAKNRLGRLRLLGDHLPHFLALQVYAQQNRQASSGQWQQLGQIGAELQAAGEAGQTDYHFEVLEGKQKLSTLCSELSKPKVKADLRTLLAQNPKWQGYLDAHCRQPVPYAPSLNELDRLQLALVISLQSAEGLTSDSAAKILEERVREAVMKERLAAVFDSEELEAGTMGEEDEWEGEWQQVLERLKQ